MNENELDIKKYKKNDNNKKIFKILLIIIIRKAYHYNGTLMILKHKTYICICTNQTYTVDKLVVQIK